MRPSVWDPPSTRSAARKIVDWERHCTLLASISGPHQSAWMAAMINSIIHPGRERVPC